MLHILGMILKIAGILLGSILGILVLLLLLILFVPVRYRGEGSLKGRAEASVRITWLFHLLSLRIGYQEELTVRFRIMGIPIKKKEIREPVKKAGEELLEVSEELPAAEEPAEQKRAEKAGEKAAEEADRAEQAAGQRSRTSLFDKIRDLLEKIKCTIYAICDRIKEIRLKAEELWDFIRDEENREAFRLIKRQTGCLWRAVRPRKLSVRCHFGFEDPALTGQALAAGAVLYPVYRDRIYLYPDFDQKILEGEASFCGRLRIFPLLLIIIRLWRNRRIRETVGKLLK